MRVPPQNTEAEQAVLGGILLEPQAYSRVSWLKPDDFYRGDHQKIYAAIQNLPEGTPADPVTLTSQLGNDLDEVGGQGYIAELISSTPTTANIHHYAKQIRDKAALRGVIALAGELADSAYEADGSVTEVVDSAERRILEVSHGMGGDSDGYADLKEGLRQTLDELDAAFQANQNGDPLGVRTGITSFDKRFGGLHRGDLIIVAGRPSMGKSALVHSWAKSLAEAKKSVGIHSVEQPQQQIHHRWLSQYSGVPVDKFRTSKFSDDDWPKVTRAFGRLNELHPYLHIHDRSNVKPSQVSRIARRMKARHGLDMLVIDYLQIMDADQSSDQRRHELDAMTRAFKNLAKELDIPVVVISQLSRSVEQRQDKRPLMSDLRESGGIEQDADLILFPYRPAYYGEDAPERYTELHVAKNRQGPTGYIECAFIEERAMFGDLDKRYDAEAA